MWFSHTLLSGVGDCCDGSPAWDVSFDTLSIRGYRVLTRMDNRIVVNVLNNIRTFEYSRLLCFSFFYNIYRNVVIEL